MYKMGRTLALMKLAVLQGHTLSYIHLKPIYRFIMQESKQHYSNAEGLMFSILQPLLILNTVFSSSKECLLSQQQNSPARILQEPPAHPPRSPAYRTHKSFQLCSFAALVSKLSLELLVQGCIIIQEITVLPVLRNMETVLLKVSHYWLKHWDYYFLFRPEKLLPAIS